MSLLFMAPLNGRKLLTGCRLAYQSFPSGPIALVACCDSLSFLMPYTPGLQVAPRDSGQAPGNAELAKFQRLTYRGSHPPKHPPTQNVCPRNREWAFLEWYDRECE